MCWFGLTDGHILGPTPNHPLAVHLLLILILGPCLVKTRTPPLRPTRSRGLPGWKFLSPKMSSPSRPEPGMSDQTSCAHQALRSKVFAPRHNPRFSRAPGSPGFAPRLKRHPAPFSPSNPGFAPQVGMNSTSGMTRNLQRQLPTISSSRGNWGGPLALGPGCGESWEPSHGRPSTVRAYITSSVSCVCESHHSTSLSKPNHRDFKPGVHLFSPPTLHPHFSLGSIT
jgi:hypothetical protein